MKVRNTVGLAVASLALASVSVLGLASSAGAHTGADGGPGGHRGPRPELTDAQKQCLVDQGVTLPERPAAGSEPTERVRPTDEQRAAMKAAAEACDLPARGPHGPRPRLTDAQKECLTDAGVTPPARSESGERVRPTEEQRTAMKAAAESCGIELPAHHSGGPGPSGTSTGTATAASLTV